VSRHTAWAWLTLAACAALAPAHVRAQDQAATTEALPASKPHDASLDDYRTHLASLSTLVDVCAKGRDMKTCDPAAVGPDDEVLPVQSGGSAPARRLVRYGWLRVLLSKAQDKDAPPPKPPPASKHENEQGEPSWENVRPIPLTTTQLLQAAKTRLASDLAQAGAPLATPPDHPQERAAMKQVLSGRDFSNLEEPSAKDSMLEKVGNRLNKVIESLVKASARAPWLGRALVWGFILAVCVGLVWGLLQLERRWRVRLVPEDRSPAPGAASAIHWQMWLEDARRAAAAGAWREAIHFLYWASISRLESKRLWPADRARTPREYLALVAPEDPRQPGLASLTGSFERIWYGGRSAAQSDYLLAEKIATALIQGSGGGAVGLEAEAAGGAAQ
jgi:hypothetical protein